MNFFSTLYGKYTYSLMLGTTLLLARVSDGAPIEVAALNEVNHAKLHQGHRTPINLARWHRGASLVLVTDTGLQRITMPEIADHEESVLLSSNSALGYKIKPGAHHFIIDLGGPMHVSRFFVNNQSATGKFSLRASNTLEAVDSDEWIPLSQPVVFTDGVIPSVTFPETKTRYILLQFDISNEGAIGNLGATGPLSSTQASVFDSVPLNVN